MHVLLSFLKWGSIGYSLGIVQWDFTRRDHLGNPGRVSGSGPVILHREICSTNPRFESRTSSGILQARKKFKDE